VFALTEDKWRPMRRRLDQYFTRSNISNMFPQVLASAKDTAERLALQAKANPPAHYHNLVPVISRSVMDSLVRCVFSREFDEVTDTARMRAIELANWYKAADFLNNVPVIKHFNPLKKDYIKYLHMLNDLSKLEVDARRELYEVDPSSAPNDLLTNILGYGIRPTLDDMQFSYENEVHNVGTFFFAGLDTTTNSLLFTIALLYAFLFLFSAHVYMAYRCLRCKHPEIMKRATEEVDRVFAELMGVHLDQESQLVPKLVYLDKIIKEATRLYPGTVGTSRVPHEDLQLGDHVIRKGTRLMLNGTLDSRWISNWGYAAGAMSRSPLHWERPDEFYPEHFNEDVTKARHPMAYFPFGGGPRICIGFRLAVQEQRVILAHLLHNFTFESHPDQKIEVFSGLTNNFIGPLLVRIAPRNHQ